MRVYEAITDYIKTGKNVSALSELLKFIDEDARFNISDTLKQQIQKEIAKNHLISYGDTLKDEVAGFFVVNKARKVIKLVEVTKILNAIDNNEGINEAIASFKNNAEAKAGFQFGFFSLKKSRAEERIDECAATFTS